MKMPGTGLNARARSEIISLIEMLQRFITGRRTLMVVTTKGVILKRRSIGEQDAILTLMTDELGIVEASAKGIKKTKSKLSAAVQPFYYSELALLRSKDRYILTGASSIEGFHPLRYDVVKVALANYLAELICYLAPSIDQIDAIKRLYLNTLFLLSNDKKTSEFIKPVCELRLMTLSGFMPDLVCCHECAAFENVPLYFDMQQGVLYCENCREHSSLSGALKPLTPSLLASLRHIIYSADEKVYNFTVSNETLKELSDTIERYVLYHLERSFRPLEIYHTLISEEVPTL